MNRLRFNFYLTAGCWYLSAMAKFMSCNQAQVKLIRLHLCNSPISTRIRVNGVWWGLRLIQILRQMVIFIFFIRPIVRFEIEFPDSPQAEIRDLLLANLSSGKTMCLHHSGITEVQ